MLIDDVNSKCPYSFHFLKFFTRFWMMPALVLKKMVMGNFDRGFNDSDICDSIDFLVERVIIFSLTSVASFNLKDIALKYILFKIIQDSIIN